MSKGLLISHRAAAFVLSAVVVAACGAVAIAQPASADAATVTVKAKNATKSFSKGATKIKVSKDLKVKVKKSSKRVAVVQLKLTGKKAKKSNIWYRVYAKGYGWMGWAKNNAKAGSLAKGNYATKLQIAIVKKSSKAQKNADRKAYSSKAGFTAVITGDKATDSKIKKVAAQNKMDLNRCYTWANRLPYGSSGVEVTEHKNMSPKHQNAIARYAFTYNRGDCYGTNVAFAKLATYLGYSADVCLGSTYRADGTLANKEYGWAIVKTAGKWNIYDAYHGGTYYNVSASSPVYKQYVQG